MSRDDFKGYENDPVALRQMAADCYKREEESFQRSDTDGCYSQFALSLSAQLYNAQAKIAEVEDYIAGWDGTSVAKVGSDEGKPVSSKL